MTEHPIRSARWVVVATIAVSALMFLAGRFLGARTTRSFPQDSVVPSTPVNQAPGRSVPRSGEPSRSAENSAVVRQEDVVLPPPLVRVRVRTLHPRAPDEWQGMLVDLSMMAVCAETARCGLAMSCRPTGTCGPCVHDADCASGELCVLDHCLRRSLAHCRSRRDCATGALCVLSGYSSGPRGNEETTADCIAGRGGTPQVPQTQPLIPDSARHHPAVDPTGLLESLRDAGVDR